MAQTTTAMSAVVNMLELSPDNSSWTAVGGSTYKVEVPEQARASGELYTFEGDTPIVTSGKMQPIDVKISGVYTPTAGEAFEFVRALFEAAGGSSIAARWTPAGSTAGVQQFSTGLGKLTSFQYPSADSTDANPIPFSFTIHSKGISITTLAST